MSRYMFFIIYRCMTEAISWFQEIYLCLLRLVQKWTYNNSHKPQGSRLENVPLEIFFLILTNLDEADEACLSLCNRTLHYKLPTSLRKLNNQRSTTRANFFQRLSRDHSQYFGCYTCSSLHHVAKLGPPCLQGDAQLGCLQYTEDQRIQRRIRFAIGETYSDFALRFEHVHLAMLRHRRGPAYGIALDMLSWADVRCSLDGGRITYLTVQPKIVAQSLYLRVQHWHVMPSHEEPNGPGLPSTPAEKLPDLCPHFNRESGFRWLQQYFKCRKDHGRRKADCPMCLGHYKCRICLTACEIDIQDYGTSGGAFIVTKWLSLGDGTSPNDWKWRRQFAHHRPFMAEFDSPVEPEDTRAMFGEDGDTKRRELITEDAYMLCNGLWLDSFCRRRTLYPFFGDCVNRDVWVRHVQFPVNRRIHQ